MKQPIKEIWINYYQRGDDPLGWATPFYSKDQAERDTTYGRTKTVHFVESERAEKAEAMVVEMRKALEFYSKPSDWFQVEAMTDVGLNIKDGDPMMVFEPGEDHPWTVAKDALARAKELGL